MLVVGQSTAQAEQSSAKVSCVWVILAPGKDYLKYWWFEFIKTNVQYCIKHPVSYFLGKRGQISVEDNAAIPEVN